MNLLDSLFGFTQKNEDCGADPPNYNCKKRNFTEQSAVGLGIMVLQDLQKYRLSLNSLIDTDAVNKRLRGLSAFLRGTKSYGFAGAF